MNTKKFMGALALLPSLVANAQMVPEIEQVAFDDLPVASTPIVLTDKEKEALRLVREWKKNPDKPIRTEDGGIMYHYGRPATLICAPLNVCAIRLRPGEILEQTSIYVGDPRWKPYPAMMGNVVNIILKPLESGLTSNMIVTTNLGSYNIQLKSSQRESMTYITFHYPEDTTQMWAKYKREQAASVEAKTMSNGTNVDSLDFNYRLSGDNPDWKPVRVYNDDKKTYIQFPGSRFPDELPVLVVMTEKKGLFSDQEYEMVNYGPIGDDRFVVDRSKLKRAALISGVGSNQVRVVIEHTGGQK